MIADAGFVIANGIKYTFGLREFAEEDDDDDEIEL